MNNPLRQLRAEIVSSINGVTDRELLFRPADKWTTTELLEHLTRSYTGTTKGCRLALQKGTPSVGKSSLRFRAARFYVLTLGKMPEGRKSPKQAEPRGELTPEEAPEALLRALDAMEAALQQCEQRFGNVQILDHFVLGPLTAQQWRKFHLVHGRHHLRQFAERRRLATAPTQAEGQA